MVKFADHATGCATGSFSHIALLHYLKEEERWPCFSRRWLWRLCGSWSPCNGNATFRSLDLLSFRNKVQQNTDSCSAEALSTPGDDLHHVHTLSQAESGSTARCRVLPAITIQAPTSCKRTQRGVTPRSVAKRAVAAKRVMHLKGKNILGLFVSLVILPSALIWLKMHKLACP